MNKLTPITIATFTFAVAAATVAGLTIPSCSSSSSSDDAKAFCVQSCNKSKECNAVPATIDCNQICTTAANNPTGNAETCTNAADIIAKGKDCLTKACAEFETCLDAVPECQKPGGATATGGSSGTGLPDAGLPAGTGGAPGGSGTGGSSGTAAGCAICEKAQMCAAGFVPDAGTSIPYKTACEAATSAQRDQLISACAMLVAVIPGCQ